MPPDPEPATLTGARRIAHENSLRYVYMGNVHNPKGGSTRCSRCGESCAGVFEARPGEWGARRQPVRLAKCPGG